MIKRDEPEQTIERSAGAPGGGLLAVLVVILVCGGASFLDRQTSAFGLVAIIAAALLGRGFYSLQPNEGAAITRFGGYLGTDRQPGLRWVPFWVARKKISLRVRNVTSETLKVNDKQGNPVEIAANIVWRVGASAQALFDVDDYSTFVGVQIETALREVTRHYAYDNADDGEPTLRADAELVSRRLMDDLQTRVAVAGVVVQEAHLMHLAYAPEVAGAMLKRQQAQAVLAARQIIVSGAVGMVDAALKQLSERAIVDLDEERKASMVSNLLVVLCGDRDTQPVLNTGTLYG